MKSRQQILGQNFLHHKPTIQKIIQVVDEKISENKSIQSILEVGPGKGALTHELILKYQHIPLYLVEKDRNLKESLEKNFSTATLEFMDAASKEFSDFLESLEQKKKAPILFVSNLPYSASSQILAQLCSHSRLFYSCIVMVQKELAERMQAKEKTQDRGAFSLLIQSYFNVTHCFDVGPGAFSPPPKVTSSVLVLTPLSQPLTFKLSNPKKFEAFCKELFSQRRKMIRNTVRNFARVEPQEVGSLLSDLGLSGTERPEELSLELVLKLFSVLDQIKTLRK